MKKRFNIRDNFEQVYLRSKTLLSANSFAESNQVNDDMLLRSEIQQAIKYIVGYFYSRNKKLFARCGFELNDVVNVNMFYASLFFKITQKNEVALLKNFLVQRNLYFLKCLQRKFFINDAVEILDSHDSEPGSVIEIQEKQIAMQTYLSQEYSDDSDSAPSGTRKKMFKNKNNLILKKLLYQNIDRYASTLCRLANSMAVSADVRKKAQKICRQYNIDFKTFKTN